MLNFGAVMRAFDAVMMFRDAAKRIRSEDPPETRMATQAAPEQRLPNALEATLTNVVVAALKEAFERDHARLELERLQIEEQRRRAEEALRVELRRQALDRELGRLRLVAGTALVGWIASVVLLVVRLGEVSTISRAIAALGWLLLLGALGAAFSAQARASAALPEGGPPNRGGAGAAAPWLLVAGLAVTAISLLL